MAVVVQLVVGELELVEGDDLFHPLQRGGELLSFIIKSKVELIC